MTALPRCCLTTPDPGAWKAGVDDGADDKMIGLMHMVLDRLSYQMPIKDLIWCCRAAVQIDSRTMLGGDIQRCLLSNAGDRMMALAEHIHPWPWVSWNWDAAKHAWAVFTGRAVAIYTQGSIYDDVLKQMKARDA